MGQEYIIDSNVVIDYLDQKLPPDGTAFVDELMAVISIISRIEILGWYGASDEKVVKLSPFVNNAFIYSLDENVIVKTILLSQQFKIEIPDVFATIYWLTILNILLSFYQVLKFFLRNFKHRSMSCSFGKMYFV